MHKRQIVKYRKSKNPIKRKRAEKRLARLKNECRIVRGVEIPKGTLVADPDQQQHAEGYSVHYCYTDIHYVCAGCKSDNVWSAEQQKRYYEIQKGNIYNYPKWCQNCHTERMQEKIRQSDSRDA